MRFHLWENYIRVKYIIIIISTFQGQHWQHRRKDQRGTDEFMNDYKEVANKFRLKYGWDYVKVQMEY